MENIIYVKFELDCDVSRAFSMFTVNKLLEAWLTEKAEVETKVGGKYELFWEPEKRNRNSTLGCKITAIEMNKFLSFNWKGPTKFEHIMNSTDPLTHVIVFFSPNNNDSEKCTIYLFHTGWRKEEHWQEARKYFEKAWINALHQLKTVSQKQFLQ
jgi:uncharacterized protein YndB with AHSA1/START domain